MRGVLIASISVAMVTVVLGCMKSQLKDVQYDKDLIDILFKYFDKADQNGDKIIDREEIKAIWAENGDEEKALFEIIDENGDGVIDETELAEAELKTNLKDAVNMVKQDIEELKQDALKQYATEQEEIEEEVNEILEEAGSGSASD
ncbi:unnamed protein product [Owenia fusiformis]|uniref:EF-hand domain-containing protein n=1 Tax=Owenia fusiformis TaxID=6347 RepID=A0A8S4Q5P2_OWEFU|nr:unnamed protein product [Owenia fusiformis]